MTLRARPFQHWMARLALAAVLLLALAPTLSRAAAATTASQALGAMCTADGLVPAVVRADAALTAEPAGATSDSACGYCPLLAQVTPFAPAALPVPAFRVPPPCVADVATSPCGRTAHAGLGARGPPRQA